MRSKSSAKTILDRVPQASRFVDVMAGSEPVRLRSIGVGVAGQIESSPSRFSEAFEVTSISNVELELLRLRNLAPTHRHRIDQGMDV